MVNKYSRRLFLAGAGSLLAGAASAAISTSLRPRLRPSHVAPGVPAEAESLIAQALPDGVVSYAVADARTGEMLEDRHAARGLPPASVAKTITALYALDTLGEKHRFATRLLARGTLRDGVLEGDLVLSGGGDPTLDTRGLAALAADLKASGLREVRGRFVVWTGALPYTRQIDAAQPAHVSYNPAICGLALNFNRIRFGWTRAGKDYGVTLDARAGRYRPAVEMARITVVDRGMPVYTYSEKAGVDHWTVARGALGNGGARWLPVRRPDLYAADVFRTLTRAHGIELPREEIAETAPGGREIAVHHSDDLTTILRAMLKYSNNLTAEMIGMSASSARTGQPVGLRASAELMSRWTEVEMGMADVALVDHSGLSDGSRLQAADMVRALVSAPARQALEPLLKTIQVQLSDAGNANDITVRAKTGTLNFVSGLAGYIEGDGGRDLAFAVFSADLSRRAEIPRAQRERPSGARPWSRRARRLQRELITRWEQLYA
ncbi:D-alanyl-D-alanine carboxypeptidase/D-alanyl-D-alanine-endopeptidase [Sediminimonas sp.]|uniref:D-alanyl-D-alanine carboxypeptidase/D-alanyl-D-alanine endopeptidase n=1 Tax=Sediminimonas sp. TaxID=2823379 RepID=UPI0025E1A6FF|nr:D-alanyl-D-alanine carboxypeptidase/D-alanyl-D-alanine-endopeptidase [Sediminimonas sp.]